MGNKVAIINSVFNIGSTGRICFELSNYLKANGFESLTFYGRNKVAADNAIYFGSVFSNKCDGVKTRLFDAAGFGSKKATKELINKLNNFCPDLVILNNLHGYYINIEILLNWLKTNNIQTIAVFHDCWNFTGHCAYYDYINCDKWKTYCSSCQQKHNYPKSILFSNSKNNFIKKKKLFSSLPKLTIVCPSQWMAEQAKMSYFKNRDIFVINNGIDISTFKHNPDDFREKFNLLNKKIILCIANIFDERKGIKDIIKLNQIIDNDYKIVVVGKIKGKVQLPANIIHIERTDNIQQLVNIYSSADVMFNPTYEDNFPTVNMESLSCGTPVISYNTGGSPETLDPNFVVAKGNYSEAYSLMKKLLSHEIEYDFGNKDFSKETMHKKYLDLINELIKK